MINDKLLMMLSYHLRLILCDFISLVAVNFFINYSLWNFVYPFETAN